MMHLLLDLKGRKAVVFGGGEVGERKALYLAREADVTVVSRTFTDGLRSSGIALMEADARGVMEGMIGGADYVVAATDDAQLNQDISRRCLELGVPFNRSDAPGTFLIPAVHEGDGFAVAVSTSGRSPLMASFIRDRIAGSDAGFSGMIRLHVRLRARLKRTVQDGERRREILISVVEDEGVWKLLEDGGDPEGIADGIAEAVASRTS